MADAEDLIRAAEKRGYSKGYAAGQRRVRAGDEQQLRAFMQEEFERQVFVTILPQLVSQPWQTGSKRWTSMEEFIDGARKFARLSAKQFHFRLPPTDNSGGAA